MVTAEIKEQVQVVERSPEKLNATATQQVSDIIKETEKELDQTKTWSYSIPFAGVRYYSYR